MILGLLQQVPIVLLLLAMLGAVVVEALSVLAFAVATLRDGTPALAHTHSVWIAARLRLIGDVGRLAVSVGFFGTVLGLIGATGAFRDGAPDALLGNLDLVLETTALGLATFLAAQLAILLLAPRNLAWLLDRYRRSSQARVSDSVAP